MKINKNTQTGIFYFSGTGNTQFIARQFAKTMNIYLDNRPYCCSIEQMHANIEGMLGRCEVVALAFPVYGSAPPRIMRDFVKKHEEILKNKKLIIFCTQAMFSGDGARSLKDVFRGNVEVLGAEHFNMPTNISNFTLLPVPKDKTVLKMAKKASAKMKAFCVNLVKGNPPKRGFNKLSEIVGYYTQRRFFIINEPKFCEKVFIDNKSCIKCGKCVKTCPVQNLELSAGVLSAKNNCVSCYRCVNLCPEKAIRVFINMPVLKQYKGIKK